MSTKISPQAADAAGKVLKDLSRENLPLALSLKNDIFRLAKEFEQAKGKPPTAEELQEDFEDRLEKSGHIRFYFNKIASSEKKYPELYLKHMKVDMPSNFSRHHDIAAGNISSVEEWIHQSDSSNLKNLQGRLNHHLGEYHIEAAERLLEYAKNILEEGQYQQLIVTSKTQARKECEIIPYLQNEDWLLNKNEQVRIDQHRKFANEFSLPLKHTYGLRQYLACDKNDLPFTIDTYLKIREFLSYEIANIADLNEKSAFAGLFFKDYKKFTDFMERWPVFFRGQLALQDSLDCGDLHFSYNIDYEEWGKILLREGPKALYYYEQYNRLYYEEMPDAEMVELPRTPKGEILFAPLKDYIYALTERNEPEEGEEFQAFKRFCFDNQLTKEEYKTAKYLIKSYSGQPDASTHIPDISIDGRHFGLPGYNFRRLSYDDPRLFFIGKYTGCCERLLDHCMKSVIHAYKTRESGFYVVTDSKDKIVAHSWAWRSQENHLVFDGFEARQNDKAITDKTISKILSAFSQELTSKELDCFGVNCVLLGVSGKNLKPHEHLPKIEDFAGLESYIPNWLSSEDEENFIDLNATYLGYSSEFYLFNENPSYSLQYTPAPD